MPNDDYTQYRTPKRERERDFIICLIIFEFWVAGFCHQIVRFVVAIIFTKRFCLAMEFWVVLDDFLILMKIDKMKSMKKYIFHEDLALSGGRHSIPEVK